MQPLRAREGGSFEELSIISLEQVRLTDLPPGEVS